MVLKITSLVFLLVGLAACNHHDSDSSNSSDLGPYSLTFTLDSSFNTPHGNDPIRIALVRLNNGQIVSEAVGTVSATDNPAFTFTTMAVMERGVSYAVHYWIDSNINGGTLGLCEATDFDHQWSTEFFIVVNDLDFTTNYEPGLMEYVCDTFP